MSVPARLAYLFISPDLAVVHRIADRTRVSYAVPQAVDRCRREVPALKAAPGGGEVACHAVEENRLAAAPALA